MPSDDYHDYVIRNGKLIGDFESMYRYSREIPWHQDKQDDWIDVRLTRELLKDLGQFDEIHDLGCGLGYYLAILHSMLGGRAVGYDISETACEKARALFPSFEFHTLDLTQGTLRNETGERRLFVIRGTLWYVFPAIDTVVSNIRNLMSSQDTLLVVQNFPPLESNFVGKDVIPHHEALISHFEKAFTTLRHTWYADHLRGTNDNWFIGIFSSDTTERPQRPR